MKERKRNPTNKKEDVGLTYKDKKEEQKINQIEGYTVTVRFSDNGLRLESLIDAYIKEKLFITWYQRNERNMALYYSRSILQ